MSTNGEAPKTVTLQEGQQQHSSSASPATPPRQPQQQQPPRADDAPPPPIATATWPDALPHPAEDRCLTIVCEQSTLWWCLHARKAASAVKDDPHQFESVYFWESSGSLVDTNKSDLQLHLFLPTLVHEHFFGSAASREHQNDNDALIREWSVTKRIPALTVYILFESDRNLAKRQGIALRHLFSEIPCRLFQMPNLEIQQATTTGQGSSARSSRFCLSIANRYAVEAIWEDHRNQLQQSLPESKMNGKASRASGENGSTNGDKKDHSPQQQAIPPVLLIHADENVISFLACDRHGNVLGEGMVPGVTLQRKALDEFTGTGVSDESALRDFDIETLPPSALLPPPRQHHHQSGLGSNSRSRALQRTAMTGILHSLRGSLQMTIQMWKDQIDKDSESAAPLPTIWVDGRMSKLLEFLLRPISQTRPNSSSSLLLPALIPDTWEIKRFGHNLAHHGMLTVVEQRTAQDGLDSPHRDDSVPLRTELVGLRVADPNDRLGTIAAVRPRTYPMDEYRIHFDGKGGVEEWWGLDQLAPALQRLQYLPDDNMAFPRKFRAKQKAAQSAYRRVASAVRASASPRKRPRPSETTNEDESPARKKQATEASRPSENDSDTKAETSHPSGQKDDDTAQSLPDSPPSKTESRAAYCESFVSRRVAKYFDDKLYFGEVDRWIPQDETEERVDLWNIIYDDNDKEDYDEEDMEEALDLYNEFEHEDPRGS